MGLGPQIGNICFIEIKTYYCFMIMLNNINNNKPNCLLKRPVFSHSASYHCLRISLFWDSQLTKCQMDN